MKFSSTLSSILALLIPMGHAFLSPSPVLKRKMVFLRSSPSPDAEQRMKDIMAQESMNKANMADSAEQMKNMKPQDIDEMIKEMDKMPDAQREQFKSMGMDPEMMKTSMQMMRDNPSMMESVSKMMENMTPEEMLAKSREAQEQMAKLSSRATRVGVAAEVTAESADDDGSTTATSSSEVPLEGSAKDVNVIDAMFRVAEVMSRPPSGGVTFAAFATLPPITVLSGEREQDLSRKELAECWADGSLGSTRVDRQGFERVWNEVQDYFEEDIMEEARKTSATKPKKQRSTTMATTSPGSTPAAVGANLNADQMAAVKNMSEQDMSTMLEQMSDMTPEQQARMKAMGVDPGMMQKTAQMMKNNPLMQKAATSMVKNMSPEQMVKTSQQAQEQMSKMSKEDYDRAMDQMMKEQGESK